MTTAMLKKKSLENKHLYCDYFAIIPTCSKDTMLANYAATGLKEDLLLFAQVAVKTANVVISGCRFANDDMELF